MTSEGLAQARLSVRRFGFTGIFEFYGADLTTEEFRQLLLEIASLKVRRLALTSSEIDQIPVEIGALSSLRELQLTNNRIVELPASLQSLRNLSVLNLSHNRIAEFPEVLTSLPVITELSVPGNLLRDEDLIRISKLGTLKRLDISSNGITRMPVELGNLAGLVELRAKGNQINDLAFKWSQLADLETVDLSNNQVDVLDESFAECSRLQVANFDSNALTSLPSVTTDGCGQLRSLSIRRNKLTELPETVCLLPRLARLDLTGNQISALDPDRDIVAFQEKQYVTNAQEMKDARKWYPQVRTTKLDLKLGENPLPPEMMALADTSSEQLGEYLNVLRREGTPIAEAKLLIVGEGNVGKTSLLAALRGDPFIQDRDTTHGLEIHQIPIEHPEIADLTLNAWDFGGQLEYRPTHQIYFTNSALYIVAWKPREGPELGQVRQWLTMISQRAGADARVLIVATHGGPRDRAVSLDEEGLKREFPGMIRGFFHVDSAVLDSRVADLQRVLSSLAAEIPHIQRLYPRTWLALRDQLNDDPRSSIDLTAYFRLARQIGLRSDAAKSLAINCHTLGNWVFYANEEGLGETIILKPDWLSAAIGRIIGRPEVRLSGGLVPHRFMSEVWSSETDSNHEGYSRAQQVLFIQLMERFELSYRVPELSAHEPMSLIAQCVPTAPPEFSVWETFEDQGPTFRRAVSIVDRSAKRAMSPSGLMYRLIVRFYQMRITTGAGEILHWQDGVLLQDRYGAMALMELDGHILRLSARGINSETFVARLVDDVCSLIEGFWSGIRATSMVACDDRCGLGAPGTGLFALDKLLLRRHRGGRDYPCSVPDCDSDVDIDRLMYGRTQKGSDTVEDLQRDLSLIREGQRSANRMLSAISESSRHARTELSQIDAALSSVRRSMEDEGRVGPRLMTFSLLKTETPTPRPVIGRGARAIQTVRTHYDVRIMLWCEHSYWPVHLLDGPESSSGIYDVAVPKLWWTQIAPIAGRMARLLKPFLGFLPPIAGMNLSEDQLESLKARAEVVSSALESVSAGIEFLDDGSARTPMSAGKEVVPQLREGGVLQAMHRLISDRDPGYGDLRRVVRPDGSYLWVHRMFRDTYHLSQPEIPAD